MAFLSQQPVVCRCPHQKTPVCHLKQYSAHRVAYSFIASSAPSVHQTIPLFARGFEMTLFHMTVTFDFFRDAGDL